MKSGWWYAPENYAYYQSWCRVEGGRIIKLINRKKYWLLEIEGREDNEELTREEALRWRKNFQEAYMEFVL